MGTAHPGEVPSRRLVNGTVTKITNFGVFIELEPKLEGLLHVSELADHKVDNPEQFVKVGEELEVRILRIDPAERKIGLSRKSAAEIAQEQAAEAAASPARRMTELKGGTEGAAGPLFTLGAADNVENVENAENGNPPENP